ncbi:hypothetical protein PLICRDRAFT_180758 [Plicaturopsis crispa FD-325 SS-3]|uniref:laccase n=1 Tax=Plicaturopsis crispa FD-325 SS-3 TaxID=944288 RepID=A0A0C9T1K7_PLICR|nr:hypothetical protein PLICRDRAFT_180758 [Plicaturopsis crispa FD-325 SS-3]
MSTSRLFVFLFIAPFVLFSAVDASIGPVATLDISNEVIHPDGFYRRAVLAGGTFPGPIIKGNKGDRFQLNVVNQLTDTSMETNTTVHWHGIHQNRTNWADGTASVTQCPIRPQKSFLYNFPVPDQAGTFWYHSHLSTQYCDGLRGPLIVYDPQDPHKSLYDVDNDSTVITLSDWYHTPAPEAGAYPFPDSHLINGLGRFPNDTASGPPPPLAVVGVTHGKRYRFRLISMACHPYYNFTIDGHNMTIIEADGENVQPLVVDQIQIFAGQRYSFVLNAQQPVGNYWIRVASNQGPTGFAGGVNSAILRYAGAKIADPTTRRPISQNPLIESNLHPLTNPAAPGKAGVGKADINLKLTPTFSGVPPFVNSMNGTAWVGPTTPVLLQILSGARRAQDLMPKGAVYTLPHGKVVEISIPGGVIAGPHPYHLHGHTFSVIQSAGSNKPNYATPVRRDVVSGGATSADNLIIRFVTDNSGPWFLHCHLDWHLELGMGMVFAEDTAGTAAHIDPIPSAWNDLCK